VALNKMDLRPPLEKLAVVESSLEEQGYSVFRISAITGEGVAALMGAAAGRLAELPEPMAEAAHVEAPAEDASPDAVQVERLGDGSYQVGGEAAERAVVMTNLENEEAVRYLHRRLQRMGVIRRLRALGAKDGDRVRIGSVELEFVE
jgi:GTP-binding protein